MALRRITALAFLLVLAPVVTQAVTEEELRQQIQALLTRISSLQVQLTGASTAPAVNLTTYGTSGGVSAGGTSSVLLGGLSLSKELERGDRGDDVSRLQAFLARDAGVYPDGSVTGLFGPLTEEAVKRFQVKCGIVSAGDYQSTGYGRVGPRTLRALSLGCAAVGGVGSTGAAPAQVGGLLRVTPITGPAPLTVTAEATVNTTRSCEGGAYLLDFGDGTAPVPVSSQPGTCREFIQNVPHTYAIPGTYTVSLGIGSHRTTVNITVTGTGTVNTTSTSHIIDFMTCSAVSGSVIISGSPRQCRALDGRTFVEGTTGTPVVGDALTANVTSGNAPLSVNFNVTINGSRSCNGGEYTLDFGDGEKTTLLYPADACRAYSYLVTHRFDRGGTFPVRLFNLPQSQVTTAATPVKTVSITVQGSATSLNVPFTLIPGLNNNPKQVEVRFALPNTCTNYTLNWGDGTPESTRPTRGGGCGTGVDNQAISHVYSSNGTYVITLTVEANGATSAQNATIVIAG